ncbi:MAG: hypothetical protein K2N88_08775 [Muribaculaceae bacterium]|nr:hypothetical protein [Muribaculaceae bacterium]
MTDFIIILSIITMAALAYYVQRHIERNATHDDENEEAYPLDYRKESDAMSEENVTSAYKEGLCSAQGPASDKKEETLMRKTIELIGFDAYIDMKERIEAIGKRHGSERSQIISLTCGPDTFDGAHELHRLLPGQPVKLVNCRVDGVEMIDVFYNGSRVGRLAFNDAVAVTKIMADNRITGAYVAEQNCYGCISSHQMDLILFYAPKQKLPRFSEVLRSSRLYVKNRKGAVRNLCMN